MKITEEDWRQFKTGEWKNRYRSRTLNIQPPPSLFMSIEKFADWKNMKIIRITKNSLPLSFVYETDMDSKKAQSLLFFSSFPFENPFKLAFLFHMIRFRIKWQFSLTGKLSDVQRNIIWRQLKQRFKGFFLLRTRRVSPQPRRRQSQSIRGKNSGVKFRTLCTYRGKICMKRKEKKYRSRCGKVKGGHIGDEKFVENLENLIESRMSRLKIDKCHHIRLIECNNEPKNVNY